MWILSALRHILHLIRILSVFIYKICVGMVLYPSWWILTQHRAEKPCIWCSCQHGASSHRHDIFRNMHMLNLTYSAFNIGFHPIGYSVVRSLSEAPEYASVIATILNEGNAWDIAIFERSKENPSMRGNHVYP